MDLSIRQIAEAFSGHEFEKAFPYLADAIQWNLVGDKMLTGKASVMETCAQSADYLAGVTTVFHRFNVIADGNQVVVDSLAEYNDQQQATQIASCDIYRFTDGKIFEITSYSVEIS